MRIIQYAIVTASLLLPCAVFSQEHGQKGEIENTIGVMSDEVVQARLTKLGYTNIRLQKKAELQYHVDAVKDGKPVFLELHPQTGSVRQFATPALRESHIRTMPLVAPKTEAKH